MDFSVLLPVYNKDNPIYFDKALNSIYTDQITKPKEIIIIVDGKIGSGLESILKKWRHTHKDLVTIYRNPKNLGLGKSLQKGLELCKFDLVARMDSDDIASTDRFKVQLSYFEAYPNLVVCGSNVSEFIADFNNPSSERRLPEKDLDIVKFARYRNPINHPSVMFKRSNILDIGGYIHMPFFEDYYLWARCIKAGFLFYNVQENLVSMRGGGAQLLRRSDLTYAKHELRFLNQLRLIRFINLSRFMFLVITRCVIRLAPLFLIKNIYSILRLK